MTMAAGSVSTQASAMFLIVFHCSPDPFAAIVPATPLDSIHPDRNELGAAIQ
jgi:hypothetical protein